MIKLTLTNDKNNDMAKFEFADGESLLRGCIFDIDIKTGKTVGIESICIK